MVIPVEQTCPKCGDRFMGSDAIGDPCNNCSVIKAMEEDLGRELTGEERFRIFCMNWSVEDDTGRG